MNDIALAVEEARTEIAAAANEILPDLCDIDAPVFSDGGSAGDSVTFSPVATNVNVSYKGLSVGKQLVVGGEAYVASHELKMVRTATTVAITPRHRIRVQARGITGVLVFEKPSINEDSMSPFLKVNAVLVAQGYQQ